MLIDTFKHEFKKRVGVFITRNVILFRRPLELYDFSTDTTIEVFKGKDVEPVLDREIEGEKIRDIISRWTRIPAVVLHGGRGGGSDSENAYTHRGIPMGGGNGGDPSQHKSDLPAHFNGRIGATSSFEQTLGIFKTMHVDDTKEHGIAVDSQGYVTGYVHGDKGSVAIQANNGEHIIHNHPIDGWPQFSGSDLIATALENSSGITASSTRKGRTAETAKYAGDYIFTKGHNFNSAAFVKAVKGAYLKGKDYNDAVDKWLKAHQKKYGYVYTFIPEKVKAPKSSGSKNSKKAPKAAQSIPMQLSFFEDGEVPLF